LYGAAKLAAYRAASLYVLPTHSENFGMTVAEALAAGTPAVVTRGAPWPGLVPERAGWWVDANVAALTACLREALACPDETLAQMGRNGRAWMERDFSWSTIGREMSAVYRWLNGRGEKPSCVHTTSSASSFDRKPALDRIRGEL
jgi:glycosyltransferase involved in cell wall biosynthesis